MPNLCVDNSLSSLLLFGILHKQNSAIKGYLPIRNYMFFLGQMDASWISECLHWNLNFRAVGVDCVFSARNWLQKELLRCLCFKLLIFQLAFFRLLFPFISFQLIHQKIMANIFTLDSSDSMINHILFNSYLSV